MSQDEPATHGIFSDAEWLFFTNCLRPLRSGFEFLSNRFGLLPYAGRLWPFLGLRAKTWFTSRQLELMLQPEFVIDQKIVFELRFVETARLGSQVRCEFYCGRYDVTDFANKKAMQDELQHKLHLLGMVSTDCGSSVETVVRLPQGPSLVAGPKKVAS